MLASGITISLSARTETVGVWRGLNRFFAVQGEVKFNLEIRDGFCFWGQNDTEPSVR